MRKKIAVVSGGDSGEFDISIQSGKVVEQYLDRSKYEVYPVIIRGDEWIYQCKHNNDYDIDKNDFTVAMMSGKIEFDCVFIAIHGTPGEDGKLQGYFDMLKIPYTACNHITSALTFNKHFCKNVVKNFNVKVAKSVLWHKESEKPDILQQLNLPLFVKPNNGGSSVGMSKVKSTEGLCGAVEKAFGEDDEILIEEFIDGREITCGVIKYQDDIIAFPVTEIISKKDWFDFEAKYDPELVDEVVPAQIPDDTFRECQQISKMLYIQLNCKGVVRFDYIFNELGIYFLEVNTVPGLTEASIVPKMALKHGISLENLFDMMVEEALGEGL